MDVDPVASLKLWAVTLDIGGREFEIPALPAADWFPVIASGDPSEVLDLLRSSPEDGDSLDDLLLSAEVDSAELKAALVEAVEQVAGRSFHATLVLATVATTHWSMINGQLAQHGFRWDVMPIAAALDAIYMLVAGNLDKDAREKFVRLLDNEALTTGKRRAPDRGKITAEFESLAGPKPTGGLTATGAPSDSERPRTLQRLQPHRQDAP